MYACKLAMFWMFLAVIGFYIGESLSAVFSIVSSI